MTSQIEQLIEDIRFNFNEDDSIILKTYIERLEQQNTALQARIKELEYPKKCFDCKDKYDCYSYRTLTEDQTYMMSCPAFEPK